ncbi:hypothetical protein Acidovoranil_27930 [Acidovorax sp. FG27]
MQFSDRLQQLPAATHIASIELTDPTGQPVATLENKPGQAGSVAVYHALAALYGGVVTPAAARLGLEWYAEHTADAKAHRASTRTSTACWPGRTARRCTA